MTAPTFPSWKAAADAPRRRVGAGLTTADMIAATIAAARELARSDAAAGAPRPPTAVLLDAAEAAGHPRTTTHPATYGYCPIIDGAGAEILAAYGAAYEPGR